MSDRPNSTDLSRKDRMPDTRAAVNIANIESKDPGIAFFAEFLGGLIGLLGLGYFYAGFIKLGVIRLIGFWLLSGVIWGAFLIFVKLTLLTGLCLFFVPLTLHIGAIYLSASDLRKTLEAAQRHLRNHRSDEREDR